MQWRPNPNRRLDSALALKLDTTLACKQVVAPPQICVNSSRRTFSRMLNLVSRRRNFYNAGVARVAVLGRNHLTNAKWLEGERIDYNFYCLVPPIRKPIRRLWKRKCSFLVYPSKTHKWMTNHQPRLLASSQLPSMCCISDKTTHPWLLLHEPQHCSRYLLS